MSLGITEIVLILIAAILLFGGKKIPELAKALGRASYEFKKAKSEIQREAKEVQESLECKDEKPTEYQLKDDVNEV